MKSSKTRQKKSTTEFTPIFWREIDKRIARVVETAIAPLVEKIDALREFEIAPRKNKFRKIGSAARSASTKFILEGEPFESAPVQKVKLNEILKKGESKRRSRK